MKQELDPKLQEFEARLKKLVPRPFECELPAAGKKRPGRFFRYAAVVSGIAALLLIGLFAGIFRPGNEEMPPVAINPPEIIEPLPDPVAPTEPFPNFLNTRDQLAVLIKEMNLEYQPPPPEPVYGIIEIEQRPLSAEETAALKNFLHRRSRSAAEPRNSSFDPFM